MGRARWWIALGGLAVVVACVVTFLPETGASPREDASAVTSEAESETVLDTCLDQLDACLDDTLTASNTCRANAQIEYNHKVKDIYDGLSLHALAYGNSEMQQDFSAKHDVARAQLTEDLKSCERTDDTASSCLSDLLGCAK